MSLLLSLAGGFVILLLYLLLCSFDFCPLSRCFCAPGDKEINWDIYGRFTMYIVIGYAVYSAMAIYWFTMPGRDLRNFKSACVDYMDIYMRIMLVGSILLFTAVLMSDFCYITRDLIDVSNYKTIKHLILAFYTASVIVSLIIIPAIVLTILLQSLYSMIFIKRVARDDCVSTDDSETEDNNESTGHSFLGFLFNKENIIGEFFYRYSLLVLWGTLGPLTLFFLAPTGDNGWAGFFLALAIEAIYYNIIYLIIWYLAFSIVLRHLLKWIVFLILPPQETEG